MLFRSTSLWALALGCTLSACASKAAAPSPEALARPLGASHWRLQSATDGQGQRISALFPRADRGFQLEFGEGRIGVQGGCNAMGGEFHITSPDQLTIGPLVSTRKGCAAALMQADTILGALLDQGARIQLQDGPVLRLLFPSGQTLVWTGAATP